MCEIRQTQSPSSGPDGNSSRAPAVRVALSPTMPLSDAASALSARGGQRPTVRSTAISGPPRGQTAPSVGSPNPRAGNSVSITAIRRGKFANSCAPNATEVSVSLATTPILSPRRPHTSESTLPERSRQIVKWREEGLTLQGHRSATRTDSATRYRTLGTGTDRKADDMLVRQRHPAGHRAGATPDVLLVRARPLRRRVQGVYPWTVRRDAV